MRIDYILLASYSYHTSNLAGLFSLFCQATSLDIYANIPVCTFMRIIAIVNSSKKRKGTSKKNFLQLGRAVCMCTSKFKFIYLLLIKRGAIGIA